MKNPPAIHADNQSSIDLRALFRGTFPDSQPEARSMFQFKVSKFGWLLLALIGAAIGTIYLSQKYKWGVDYLIPLAQGVFGSAAVGFLIDGFARQQLLKEVSKEIFGHLVRQFFPKEARLFINSFIRTETILSDMQYHYVFTILPDGNVRVEVHIDGNVKNYSGRNVSYTPKLAIEKKFLPEVLGLTAYLDETDRYTWTAQDMTPKADREKIALMVEGKEVTLTPITPDSNQPYRFSWDYAMTSPMDGEDYISHETMAIGIQVRASYDSQRMSVDIEEKVNRVSRIDARTWRTLENDALFLRQQYIRISWNAVQNKTIAPL